MVSDIISKHASKTLSGIHEAVSEFILLQVLNREILSAESDSFHIMRGL